MRNPLLPSYGKRATLAQYRPRSGATSEEPLASGERRSVTADIPPNEVHDLLATPGSREILDHRSETGEATLNESGIRPAGGPNVRDRLSRLSQHCVE